MIEILKIEEYTDSDFNYYLNEVMKKVILTVIEFNMCKARRGKQARRNGKLT
jgi:hypothetical protein